MYAVTPGLVTTFNIGVFFMMALVVIPFVASVFADSEAKRRSYRKTSFTALMMTGALVYFGLLTGLAI